MVSKTRSEYGIGLKDETAQGAASVVRNLTLIKGAAEGIKKGLAGIAAGLSVGAATAAIKSVIDYGDRLNDLAKSTGATVEQLSFLDYAAKQSGSTLEGLTAGIGKLQKNLFEVSQGGGKQAAKALESLGLNAKDLLSQDLQGQLTALAAALGKIENPTQRAALAQAILSKSYREFLPFLAEGEDGIKKISKRFAELSGELSTENVKRFDALNDSITDLETAARAAGTAVAVKLSPALTALFTGLADGFAPDSFQKQLQGRAKVIREQIGIIEAQLRAGTLDPEGRSFFVPDVKLSEAAKAKFRATVEELRKELETVLKTQEDFRKRNDKPIADPTDTGPTEDETKAREKLVAAQDKYLNGLRQQFIQQTNNTELAKLYNDIASGSVVFINDKAKDTAIALATQLDALKDQKALLDESAEVHEYLNGIVRERAQLEEKADQALAQRRKAIIDNLQTPLEKYVETVKELTDPRFGFNGDEIARGIKNARDELVAAQEKASGLKDVAHELGLTFTSAAEDAFLKWEGFGNLLEGIAQDIARLFIRRQITEPFLAAFAPEGGGGLFDQGMNWLSGLFGNARGGLYQVGGSGGEHPVAFTARRGEYVAVGTSMESGGDQPSVVVNNYGPRQDIGVRNNGRQIEVTIGTEWAKNVGAGRMAPLGIRPPLATR